MSSSTYIIFFQDALEKDTAIVNYTVRLDTEYPRPHMKTKQESSTVLEAERSKSKPPKLYKVVLFNDDYTTMEFVIEVLQTFFSMNRERATQVMLKVHQEGSAVCGVYPQDIAATKVKQVSSFAKQYGHPLRCEMEVT